jgi:uncharacterized membrane protein
MAAAVSAKGWPRLLQPFVSRPHLLAAIAVGAIAYFVDGLWIGREMTRLVVAWDAAALLFISLSLASMAGVDHERMKRRAVEHDEGRHVILALALVAAAASVAAILAELGGAKGLGPLQQTIKVGLTAGTIGASWFFLQLVFAIHYAHVFYLAEAAGAAHKGGLDFPDDLAPDYWDFLYFALVIGATSQTADVNIQSKELRRIAAAHGVIAFAFNTAILATMINLAAGLF